MRSDSLCSASPKGLMTETTRRHLWHSRTRPTRPRRRRAQPGYDDQQPSGVPQLVAPMSVGIFAKKPRYVVQEPPHCVSLRSGGTRCAVMPVVGHGQLGGARGATGLCGGFQHQNVPSHVGQDVRGHQPVRPPADYHRVRRLQNPIIRRTSRWRRQPGSPMRSRTVPHARIDPRSDRRPGDHHLRTGRQQPGPRGW